MSSKKEARGHSMRARVLLLILLLIAVLVFTNSFRVPEANAVPIELFYDNGTATFAFAAPFDGVRFSLPLGVSSAHLLTVRYQYGNVGTERQYLNIHITGPDHVTPLTPAIPTEATVISPGFNDLDVSALGIIVSGDFYIILEPKTLTGSVMADSGPSAGRSFVGITLAGLTSPVTYNLIIRAVIDPIMPTPTPTPAPVGGVFVPVNKLDLLAPYLALLGLVGAVTTVFAVRRRRKP